MQVAGVRIFSSMYGVFPVKHESVGLMVESACCVCVCDIFATGYSLAFVNVSTKT